MGNIDLRNPRTLGIIALAVVALVVGLIAYNAGLASGLAQSVPVTRGPGVGPAMHGGFGFFGFLGFLFKLFFFFLIVALILKFFFGRGPLARGGRGPWGGPAEWQARREEKMREWYEFQEWKKARAASDAPTQAVPPTQPAPRQDPPAPGNVVA